MKKESFSCCGYVNIRGLMCRNCGGWKKEKFLTITKEKNEKWHPDNAI